MWSEYEQYLQAARAAQEAGIDIFPQAAFVVKVSLLGGDEGKRGQANKAKKDLLEEEERGDGDSDKLFINVCTDACVDAPEIVKQPNDNAVLPTAATSSTSTPAPATPPPGSLRLPMSVGPLTPCTSRSGAPSLSVDVVIHPSTLAQPLDATHSQAAYQYAVAQAALIQRQSGTAPPVLTPAQQQAVAVREVRRTVAAFALQRVEEKYMLRVEGESEMKFPKAAYKGSLPPPAQRIRRNKDNPLHAMTPQQREEAEKRGKVLVQEVTQPLQSKQATTTAPAKAVSTTPAAVPLVEAEATPPAKQLSEQATPSAVRTDSAVRPEVEKRERLSNETVQTDEQVQAVQQPATTQAPACVTPAYTLDTDDGRLTLQVQLPGVVSLQHRPTQRTAGMRPLVHQLTTLPLFLVCLRCSGRVLKWTPPSLLLTSLSQHTRRTVDLPTSCTSYSPQQWTTSACKPNSTRRRTSSHSPCHYCPNSHQHQHQHPMCTPSTHRPQQLQKQWSTSRQWCITPIQQLYHSVMWTAVMRV